MERGFEAAQQLAQQAEDPFEKWNLRWKVTKRRSEMFFMYSNTLEKNHSSIHIHFHIHHMFANRTFSQASEAFGDETTLLPRHLSLGPTCGLQTDGPR